MGSLIWVRKSANAKEGVVDRNIVQIPADKRGPRCVGRDDEYGSKVEKQGLFEMVK